MRVMVQHECPDRGERLALFAERGRCRYQAIATRTATGRLAFQEAVTARAVRAGGRGISNDAFESPDRGRMARLHPLPLFHWLGVEVAVDTSLLSRASVTTRNAATDLTHADIGGRLGRHNGPRADRAPGPDRGHYPDGSV